MFHEFDGIVVCVWCVGDDLVVVAWGCRVDGWVVVVVVGMGREVGYLCVIVVGVGVVVPESEAW